MSKTPNKTASGIKIHEFIAAQLEIAKTMGKTQRDVAEAIGYDKPNPVNMMAKGTMKVPLDKVPLLARALNVDAGFLFRLALNQYWPDAADAIAQIFGTPLTKNEKEIIEFIRGVSKNSDPSLSRDVEAKLRAAFKE
ncbi:helix-turn-helix transcriptional regulator [Bradyrhizobium sp. 179]|uniref:helix-turn-helix domain-containing protein n=1 Tax=Bradyrhizobium sp. 179 TaxID=2782648 RepID=UPI001FFBF069|nr:helix-turn-helix transcriptional regulator [Bradyrhizobium sp. 179]MCK1543295.1 helix-turn-helix transcriptional regulator [Bradyrhizobium sp. 179]